MGDAAMPSQGTTTSVATPTGATPPSQHGPYSVTLGLPDPGTPPTKVRTKGFALPSVSWRNLPGGRIALVVAVVSFLITGWILAGRQTGQAVHVSIGEITCTGAKVHTPGGDGQPPTITPRAGMRCVLPVKLTNDGAFEVRVTRAILPTLGPEGTATVRARQVDGAKPDRSESGLDAVFSVSERLAPGESTTLKVVLDYREGGCVAKGDPLVLPHVPVLNTRALAVNSRVQPDSPVAFAHTTAEACTR